MSRRYGSLDLGAALCLALGLLDRVLHTRAHAVRVQRCPFAILDFAATRGEGNQNVLRAYLTAAVLVGLLANTAFGRWCG